jgi:hypothetical protein
MYYVKYFCFLVTFTCAHLTFIYNFGLTRDNRNICFRGFINYPIVYFLIGYLVELQKQVLIQIMKIVANMVEEFLNSIGVWFIYNLLLLLTLFLFVHFYDNSYINCT